MRVDNFILFAPGASEPPALPWAAELAVDGIHDIARARDVSRWVELGGHVYGDGQVLAVGVWGLVTDHRNADNVIDSFMAHDFGPDAVGVVLLVYRQGGERAEVYYRDQSTTLARRLAGAVGEPA